MVRKNVLCHVEPEFGHLGQHSSFLSNVIFQDNIKAADPVGSYHDQIVAVVVNLADFSFFNRFHLIYLTFSNWIVTIIE